MLIRMDVTPKAGAPRHVIAEAQDLVAFEREFNKSVTSFQDNVFLSDLFWLAWHAEKRELVGTPDFDDWVASLEMIGVADEQAIVPLESTPPTGS